MRQAYDYWQDQPGNFFCMRQTQVPPIHTPFRGRRKGRSRTQSKQQSGVRAGTKPRRPTRCFFSKKGFSKVRSSRGARGSLGQAQIIDSFVLFLDRLHTQQSTPLGSTSDYPLGLSEEASWKQAMIRKRPRLIYNQAFPHVLANRFGSLWIHIV